LRPCRGLPNWFDRLPAVAAAPAVLDSQSAVDKDLRNPYTERWSFGLQRQPSQQVLLDVSYVGSESHKVTTKADFNPRLLNGQRIDPAFGPRHVRTRQARADRRQASRHTLRTGGTNNFDVNLTKSVRFGEKRRLESLGGAERLQSCAV
jgi:hypothetical protein